ncbi:MAG: hypothetical protein M3R50_03185 [Bacteroidota bacterium]|nr:hypothetical protein [Bacteroidota bacterium]
MTRCSWKTTTMQNDYGQQIAILQYSEPTVQVKGIYTAIHYKSQPFTRKKSVVPTLELKKKQSHEITGFLSG